MQKTICTLFFTALLTALSAQNWQPMAIGVLPPDQGVYAVSAIGDNIVWAVASGENNPIPATHKPWILRTSNGGQTWVTTQDFGGGAGRALYKTTDGGIT